MKIMPPKAQAMPRMPTPPHAASGPDADASVWCLYPITVATVM
uniref:Pip2d n=1 Tax=Arundo donax TaxID=35708 RepID=A0A0A9DWF2_ARUDO